MREEGSIDRGSRLWRVDANSRSAYSSKSRASEILKTLSDLLQGDSRGEVQVSYQFSVRHNYTYRDFYQVLEPVNHQEPRSNDRTLDSQPSFQSKDLRKKDVTAHPVNHNILSVHPGGFRARQESYDGRDFINLSDAFQWVHVRNGRNELLWFPISEQCGIDGTWRL